MWKNGEKPLVYLAGAIENAPDRGRGWRGDITEFVQNKLKHEVFNPCLEENHVLTPEEFRNFHTWKTNDINRFRQTVRKIIKTDLEMLIHKVDYIICFWDEFVSKGGGTQGELTMAFWHKVPVYLVSTVPLESLSSWIIGCATEIFPEFETLERFLKETYKVLPY
jgi:hypothetical protein